MTIMIIEAIGLDLSLYRSLAHSFSKCECECVFIFLFLQMQKQFGPCTCSCTHVTLLKYTEHIELILFLSNKAFQRQQCWWHWTWDINPQRTHTHSSFTATRSSALQFSMKEKRINYKVATAAALISINVEFVTFKNVTLYCILQLYRCSSWRWFFSFHYRKVLFTWFNVMQTQEVLCVFSLCQFFLLSFAIWKKKKKKELIKSNDTMVPDNTMLIEIH